MWTDFNEIEKLAFESQPLPKYHAQSEQKQAAYRHQKKENRE